MNLPNGILEKLCCDYCKNYLSCGPIFLNYKTNSVCCGRCTTRKQSATNVRYTHFETIASVLLFPCKYAKDGCTQKLLFSPENTHKHEQTCGYKKRACPMRSSRTEPHAKCKWAGRPANLLHHCKILHPDKITANPCVFQHEFTRPLHETYLITAFNLLFIYGVKFTDEITINVRLIGDEAAARLFKYTLKIFTRNSSKLLRDGAVLAENSNSEPLVLNVDSLTGIFNGISTANFKLTIDKTELKLRHCRFCARETKLVGACADCKQTSVFCRFNKNGCAFTDVSPEKCKKHELYFCKYLIECSECNLTVSRNTLFKHYSLNHGAFRAKTGRTFHINEGYKQYCILLSSDALFLCKFSLACYRLLFSVFSPFATDELKVYCCEIRINDPGNRYNHKLTPKFDLNNCYDWNINVNMYNYPMWRHYGLDLCVFIRKKGEL